MSHKSLPWMAFYREAFLADLAVQRMSEDERRRYLWACMMVAPDAAEPGLGTEEEWRDWLDYGPEDWDGHRGKFLRAMKVQGDGRWLQKRVREEHDEREERSRGYSEHARHAARMRWDARSMPNDAHSMPDDARSMPDDAASMSEHAQRCSTMPNDATGHNRTEQTSTHTAGSDDPAEGASGNGFKTLTLDALRDGTSELAPKPRGRRRAVAPPEPEYTETFLQGWGAYLNRVRVGDKRTAFEIWESLQADRYLPDILRAIALYRNTGDWERGSMVEFSRWLKERRWQTILEAYEKAPKEVW